MQRVFEKIGPEPLTPSCARKLVQDAELRLGPVSQAVITVPAYFDETRRKATHDAGRIAWQTFHGLGIERGIGCQIALRETWAVRSGP